MSCTLRKLFLPIATFAFAASGCLTDAADFANVETFTSVDAFVSSVTDFHPATSKEGRAILFSTTELGQPEDPHTGTRVFAEKIDSCGVLWAGSTDALVFALARPRTEATHSAVGILFLLHRSGQDWGISDFRKCVAAGKYADVTAELTADVGTSYQLGSEENRPVITIKETQGGRGYSYGVSASYTLRESRLHRLDLD
jgi:hypothetical protein